MTSLRHVLVARHGETDWNAAGRWQGHTDVPLNATGRAQALALAERLRGEGLRSIATSDLSRAHATAELVASSLGLEVGLVDRELREQRFGRFEGLTPAECEERYPEEWARYAVDPAAGPPGGEPRDAFVERVLRAVAGAAGRLPSPVLVVTHGGALRALVAASGAPAPTIGRIPNGAVLRVGLSGGRAVAAAWIDLGLART